MKRNKLLSILLVLVMCVSLCACGGETDTPAEETAMTKEEMLAVAEECSSSDIEVSSRGNIAQAKQKYCNKTLLLSGQIINIKEDYIVLGTGLDCIYITDVYLDSDEIASLALYQPITVVGITTDEIIDDSQSLYGNTLVYSHYQMTDAYFVETMGDVVECTGVLKGVHEGYAPAFNISINGSEFLRLIYFAEDVDTSTLEYNQEIRFSAKEFDGGAIGIAYYEAKIIN